MGVLGLAATPRLGSLPVMTGLRALTVQMKGRPGCLRDCGKWALLAPKLSRPRRACSSEDPARAGAGGGGQEGPGQRVPPWREAESEASEGAGSSLWEEGPLAQVRRAGHAGGQEHGPHEGPGLILVLKTEA